MATTAPGGHPAMGEQLFPCCPHCNLGTVAGMPVPCGDDHGDPCTHEGCPGREAYA
jgi:hypothetical protein